jgi:hypothetical protein
MGRSAQSAWIIALFALALGALAPRYAHAAATAQGVALSAVASCNTGDLDLTLTTSGASTENWSATNLAGATLAQGPSGGPTGLSNWPSQPNSPTFFGFKVGPFLPQQPPDTLIGSYANVGESPPNAADTAEFFVYYNCSTRQVLYSCYGAYGSCPKTAQAAAALVAPGVPTLDRWALPLTVLMLAAAGGLALRRRSAR